MPNERIGQMIIILRSEVVRSPENEVLFFILEAPVIMHV
jgi:hypothetical protein